MKKILAIFLLTTAFSLTSNAGIHVEPYIGFEAGAIDETVSGTPYSDGLTGMGFGLRVGYSIPFFWAALDYSTASSLTSEVSKQLGAADSGASATRLGITGGFTLIPMLDLMAGYILSADLTQNLPTEVKLSGSGYKIGLGFTMLPFVSIIAEYFNISYDDTASVTNVTEKGVMLSLSLPLDL